MTQPLTQEEHQANRDQRLSAEKQPSHLTSARSSPLSMMYMPTKFSRFQILPPVLCTRRVYVQVGCVLLLAFIVFLVRAMSAMRGTFVQFHLEIDTDGELVILPVEFAEEHQALCLDGSPPAYYYRQSVVPAVRFWIIHLQSGGWCTTEEECLDRSETYLGSSLEASISQPLEGFMSSDCSTNPDFCMWHVVELLYCDGGSFLGNRSEPLTLNTKQLYLRGAVVFDALITFLTKETLFKDAEQIILAGSSAGGLGALIHADRLRERLPPTVTTLHVIVDGSLFLDMPDAAGIHTMGAMLQNIYHLHHVHKAASIKECSRLMNSEEEWRCILPEVFHKYVFSPVIFLNSLYDTWYRENALKITCPIDQCPDLNLSQVQESAERLVHEGKEILRAKKNGAFFTSCPAHTMLVSGKFRYLTSKGQPVQKALGAWIHNQGNSADLIELLPVEEAVVSNLCSSKSLT